jgi:hypothetical protein
LQAAYVSQNTHRNTLLEHTLFCFNSGAFTSSTYATTLKSGDDRGMKLLGPFQASTKQSLIMCLGLINWKYDLQRFKRNGNAGVLRRKWIGAYNWNY